MRSPGLKGFKQVRSLTKAEDTGLSCIEFYSAGRNPNDDLAEFLFLKLKACKEAIHKTEKGWHLSLDGQWEWKFGGYPCPEDLEEPSGNRTWKILIWSKLLFLFTREETCGWDIKWCAYNLVVSLARNPVVGLSSSPPFFLLHIKSSERKENLFPWLWNIVSHRIPRLRFA